MDDMATPQSDTYTKPADRPLYAGSVAPAPAPQVSALTLVMPSPASGLVGAPVTGSITNTGAAAGNFSLSSNPAATFTPSSGSVPAGGAVSFTMTPLAAAVHTVSLLNLSGGTVSGSPGLFTSAASAPPPPPPPTPPAGSTITTVRLSAPDNGALASGTHTYAATVLPLRGQVPSGARLVSPDDPTMDSSVVARWPDGSASIVVVAGSLTLSSALTPSLRVQTATSTPPAALTPAAISAVVQSVQVEFGGGFGTASLTDFSAPERIWWANSRVICASYRVAAPTPGSAALEASIVIHAHASGRAHVETRGENCKLSLSAPAAPASASYTAAVVRVNGQVVATVNGNAAPEGAHAAFRSWYAAVWVGGNPGVRAVQAAADLQRHPLLFRLDQAITADPAPYAADAYSPWTAARQRASNMGGTGDAASIGPLPRWAALALGSGDARFWNSVEVNSLACLGYGINYRDSATGRVPTLTDIGTRAWNNGGGGWPITAYGGSLGWEVAHHPAEGLMAFIARPSPVYIELAQCIAVTNGTYSSSGNGSFAWTAGVAGFWYQTRGKAWTIRSLAHAAFLCPDSDSAWRSGAINALSRNFDLLDLFRTDPKATLGFVWDNSPSSFADMHGNAGAQHSIWQHYYLAVEAHKVAQAGLLTGDAQTKAVAVADWCAQLPARFVNEQPNGGWRFVPNKDTVGSDALTIASQSTWGAERMRAGNHGTTPPASVSGTWMSGDILGTSFSSDYGPNNSAGGYYPSYLVSALAAAVERGVSGADQAWNTVQANITNWSTWRAGFGADPRWGNAPRSASSTAFLGSGSATGSFSNGVLTPGFDGAGRLNAASWALAPTGQWFQVAGTRIVDTVKPAVEAAIPGFQVYGTSGWNSLCDNWNGLTEDQQGARYWLICPGGHNGGSFDGIVRFDASMMRWAVEKMPSNPAQWTPAYRSLSQVLLPPNPQAGYAPSSFALDCLSLQQEEQQRAAGTLQPINGWWRDENYVYAPQAPVNYASPTGDVGQPCSGHQYSRHCYVPSTNELIFANQRGRLWKFSLAENRWTYKRPLNDGNTFYGESGGWMHLDESTNTVGFGTAADGNYNSIGFSLGTNTWVPFSFPWSIWGGADARLPNNRVAQLAAVQPTGSYDGRYWVYNLATRSVETSGSLQPEAGLSRADYAAGPAFYDGNALCYIPPINRYWWWNFVRPGGTGALRMEMFEIDPTTTPWTIRRLPESVGRAFGPHPNLMRKMVWVPVLNAVMLIDLSENNARFFKF